MSPTRTARRAPAPTSSRSSASPAPSASATSSPSAAPRRSRPSGGTAAKGDVYGQAKRILEIIGKALADAGAGFEHVTRTRVILTDMALWDDAAQGPRRGLQAHPPGDHR